MTEYHGRVNPRGYPSHERVWCACLRGTLWLASKNKGRRCAVCRKLGVPRPLNPTPHSPDGEST